MMSVSVISREFQTFTPVIDILNDLPVVLCFFTSSLFLCFVGYFETLFWKNFWLFGGKFEWKALCITKEVLNSTTSVNFNKFNCLNRGVVWENLPDLHMGLMAFFWVVLIFERLLLYRITPDFRTVAQMREKKGVVDGSHSIIRTIRIIRIML